MIMKKYWNLFYLLALVIITSCSGGDDPINTTWTALSASPDTWDNNKRADITYQILVYSFADSNNDGIGNFKGIQDKLDYINSLGVDAIWLSPIHPADSYHGYDVTDYTTVNKAYGSESDFKKMLKLMKPVNTVIIISSIKIGVMVGMKPALHHPLLLES